MSEAVQKSWAIDFWKIRSKSVGDTCAAMEDWKWLVSKWISIVILGSTLRNKIPMHESIQRILYENTFCKIFISSIKL